MSPSFGLTGGVGPAPLGGPIWGYGTTGGGYGTGAYGGASVPDAELMMQVVVTLGADSVEGQVINAVTLPWFAIVDAILRDPSLLHQANWRKMEEIIAGAYKADGWDVILTPRSNDKGKDVIATRHDFGSIRVIEQVKAYAKGHLVTFEEVMSTAGVLNMDKGASKAIITTTSDFAPGVYSNPGIIEMMPSRLDLRPGPKLIQWLDTIARKARLDGGGR